MENDSISSSSSESKLPLIVGVLGFILGAVALIFAIKAKSGAEAAAALANDSKQLADAVSNTVAGKANSSDLVALQADLAATKQQTEANEKALGDRIAELQKVATSKPVAGSGKNTTPPGPGEYAVAKGDTLGAIARKVGLSVKALQDLNPGVNPNKMQIGQRLKTK